MKVCVFTLGCKVNEVESAWIMSALSSLGCEVTDKLCYAQAYILNTCAVTREAEKKSRQLIARARRFNPEAKIFVCGCASQKNPSQFKDKGAAFVGGAVNKRAVVESFCKIYGGEADYSLYPQSGKTRAFIKVEDGCDNFCSYCIIPYLRGRAVSRPIEDVVAEVGQCPCPEVVLTGINLSAYGGGLDKLVRALSFTDKRVRLGSLECNVIDENLLSALKELKNFAPQFHLSLQSGSDAVLKSMNRRYTSAQYLEKCDMIYSAFPDAAITTDIIAGFPTETEADFEKSLEIIEKAGFARVHGFAFSPREGTAAYKLPDLPESVKRERLSRLLKRAAQSLCAFTEKNLGLKRQVIFEEYDGEYTSGYTDNYIKVYIKGFKPSGSAEEAELCEIFRDGAKVKQ